VKVTSYTQDPNVSGKNQTLTHTVLREQLELEMNLPRFKFKEMKKGYYASEVQPISLAFLNWGNLLERHLHVDAASFMIVQASVVNH